MSESEKYIEQINKRIMELNPQLILLFGPYAYGIPHKDSEIDLLVVTDDEFVPKNYDERIKLQLSVSKRIVDISMQNSVFAQEISKKGKILYERNNKTMA